MIGTPQIEETALQPAAVIHVTIARHEIRTVMGPGLRELMAAVAAQGIAATGPWFTHHLRTSTDTFDCEIGVPVASAVKAAGRVKPGQLPAATVARTIYHGPYEGLAQGWGEFIAWTAAHGHAPASDFWETYVAGPETGLDTSKFRTKLTRPLTALRT